MSQPKIDTGQCVYQPAFNLEEAARCTWICDGSQRIALFFPDQLNLDWWAYQPGTSLITHPELPYHYDMATRLNLHAMVHWRGLPRHPEQLSQTWNVAEDSVTLTIDGAYADGGHTQHRWRVWYDAEIERYRYQLSADFQVATQASIEFCNFYVARMLHSDPSQRRFTHTVWRGEDGCWHAFPHNSPLMIGHSAGAHKYLPATDAEFGMLVDPYDNPFCRVVESSRPLIISTCDQLWDEHLVVPMPSMCERKDGLYHSWATVEWFSRTQEEAIAILAEAEEIPIVELDRQRVQRPAFHVGRLCDFEEFSTLTDPQESMTWAVDLLPGARIVDDPARAHSGRRSLGLCVEGAARCMLPFGANVQVGAGGKGQLSVWINTEKLHGEAWIELRSYRFQYHQIERSYASRRIPAGTGWTQVVIDGVTADSPYLHPFLWAEGNGEALFDDVLLVVT